MITPMLMASTGFTMDRQTNRQALKTVLGVLKEAPDADALIRLRRVAYLHAVVELVLSERVEALPEVAHPLQLDLPQEH